MLSKCFSIFSVEIFILFMFFLGKFSISTDFSLFLHVSLSWFELNLHSNIKTIQSMIDKIIFSFCFQVFFVLPWQIDPLLFSQFPYVHSPIEHENKQQFFVVVFQRILDWIFQFPIHYWCGKLCSIFLFSPWVSWVHL